MVKWSKVICYFSVIFIFAFSSLSFSDYGIIAERAEDAIARLRGVLDANRACQSRKKLKILLYTIEVKLGELRQAEDDIYKQELLRDIKQGAAEMGEINGNIIDKLNPLCDTSRIQSGIEDLLEVLRADRRIMSPEIFDDFMNRFEEKPFDKDRTVMLESVSEHYYFFVDQLVYIFRTYDFDTGRLLAASIVKNKIIDPENIYKLYETMDFSSKKEDLREILEP